MRTRVCHQLRCLPELRHSGINLLLVFIAVIFKPSGDGVVNVGWSFGAFIGLIAAIAALAPMARSWYQARQ